MRRWPSIVTASLILAFVLYFGWFGLGRHAKTNSGRFDLGNVEQVVWNVAYGHGFVMTDPYGTETVSRLAFHADPFLMTLVPFYIAWPDTSLLILLQILAVASGGIAIFLIANRVFGRAWWGTLFAGLYLGNPALHWATIFDVHAVTFATPLILWSIFFAQRRRYVWTLVFVLVAMTTKEEIGLGLAAIGGYVWWWQHQRRWGLWLTVIPVVWSLLMFFVVIPHFRLETVGDAEVYRSVFGSGATEVVTGALADPPELFRTLFARHNLVYGWQLFSASGWFGLVGIWWLAAVPDLVINALSLKPAQHLIISHYSGGITSWLIVSSVVGSWWFIRLASRRYPNRLVEPIVAGWFILWLGYAIWTTGPLPMTPHDQTKFVTWRNPYAQEVREWSKRIPNDASVSVTNNVGAHFARREHLYSFPLAIDRADYLVVLEDHATPVVATQAEVRAAVAEARQDTKWEIIHQRDELTIMRRR